MTNKLTTGESFIEISTAYEGTDEHITSIITHELGHTFGLGHYVTNNEELKKEWNQGVNVPSIMVEQAYSEKAGEITELDLQKMVSIYGTDGFEKNHIPEWVRNTAGWWSEGLISDDEYLDSIQYLINQGIIQA